MQQHSAAPERLRRQSDFARLREMGRAARSNGAVVVYLANGRPQCRYAVVAGRRAGKATRRNRAKRILREAQRSLLRRMRLAGVDLLLIARPRTAESTSRELEEQIFSLYKKEGLDHIGADAPGA